MGQYKSAQKLRRDKALYEITSDPTLRALAQSRLGITAGAAAGSTKTIVDGSATSLFDVACLAGAGAGGLIRYNVFASDGTDHQSLSGLVTYAMVNKAGTNTLTITEVAANQAKAVSAGTLTLAWTFVTGTNKGTVKLQPTGSLTETIYRVIFNIDPIVGAVTLL